MRAVTRRGTVSREVFQTVQGVADSDLYSLVFGAVPAPALAAKQGLPERSQRSILIAMARKGRTRTRRTTSALGGYTTPEDIQDLANLAELGRFCRRLGREAKQGEVGLVVGDEYFAIRQFEEV